MEIVTTQTLYAVTDPNWGEPFVISETIRADRQDSINAILRMNEYGIYHGGSMWPMPNGTMGNWDSTQKHGFKVCTFKIAEMEIEQ